MEFRGEKINGTELYPGILFMDVVDDNRVGGFINRFDEDSVTLLDTPFGWKMRQVVENNDEAYIQAVNSLRGRIKTQPDEVESVRLAKHYDDLGGFSDEDGEWDDHGVLVIPTYFIEEILGNASVNLRSDLAKGRVALFALGLYSPENMHKEPVAVEMRNTGGLDGTLEKYAERAVLEKIAPYYEVAHHKYNADLIDYGITTARHLFNNEKFAQSLDVQILARLVSEGYIAAQAGRTLHSLIRERMDKEVIRRVEEFKAKYGEDHPDLREIDRENSHLRRYTKEANGNVVATEVSGHKWLEYDATRDIYYDGPDDSMGYYLP